MSVQVICSFHKDPIKTKQAYSIQGQICWVFFWHYRASNSRANGLIWLEFVLVQDFMPDQVTCKFHKVQLKLSRLCFGQG